MRFKISINLPWPVATLIVALLGALLTGIALLNYYSFKRIGDIERLNGFSLSENKDTTNNQTIALLKAQADALAQAKLKLADNASENLATNEQLQNLKKTVEEQNIKDATISSADLNKYLTGVAQIICLNNKGSASVGSGSLWNFKEVPYAVLTNYHVVKDQKNCVIHITNSNNETMGVFSLEGAIYTFNSKTDTAVIAIGKPVLDTSAPIESYNYAFSTIRRCPDSLPLGTPVVLIGFPTFTKRDAKMTVNGIGTFDEIYRSVTNGIISGYDTSLIAPHGNLSYKNFFVSSKIDAGNSGGVSLAKDDAGMCLLGLPTWLTMGTYENQGLVQNIVNVIP
jgi:S1-C subfamily serine protease